MIRAGDAGWIAIPGVWAISILAALALPIALLWIAFHFIAKFW